MQIDFSHVDMCCNFLDEVLMRSSTSTRTPWTCPACPTMTAAQRSFDFKLEKDSRWSCLGVGFPLELGFCGIRDFAVPPCSWVMLGIRSWAPNTRTGAIPLQSWCWSRTKYQTAASIGWTLLVLKNTPVPFLPNVPSAVQHERCFSSSCLLGQVC